MKVLEKAKLVVDSVSVPHGREIEKPNEDKLLVDKENGIFIVLDGVTRVHAEYEATPFESAALDVSEIFLRHAYEYIKAHICDPDPKEILESAVMCGNLEVRKYREKKSLQEWEYYPSTVGIMAILRDGTLHYLCVGDCLGVLLRGSAKILFGRQFALEAVDLTHVSKKYRYDNLCNHPKNHLSYTVYNGDEEVMNGLDYSFIDLHEGDVVFLASDGIGNYLRYEKNADLIKQSADEIIALSGKYDIPPYAEYEDDKTLIKLLF